ncbi:MAG: hypothetical protein M3362_01875 [Acidobacteriota bacterium]|nr:hypothetical protein [Acidobacteriota bacterium]
MMFAQGGALLSAALSNNGMHPTRDTSHFMYLRRAGGRVMPGVRRRYDKEERCSEWRGWLETYYGSRRFLRGLRAA